MDVQDHPLYGASGLTDEQAKEVHGYFMTLTIVYVAIALVAHYLMWIWRPWLGG
ncbi:MAG: light-harvesting antenna LH1, beta subunit [Pseudomonadota bacterium]